eukprot:Em0013g979a
MAEKTRRLLQESEEHMFYLAQGRPTPYRCVVMESLPRGMSLSVYEEYKRKHHSFDILDSVLDEFLKTNSWGYVDLSQICSSRLTRKTFLRYVHASIPYLATVFEVNGTDQKVWVNVKLCNNSFVYVYKPGETIERNNSDGWIQFDECLLHMPILKANLRNAGFQTIDAYYSYDDQRLDIKAWTCEDDAPNLVLTFEPGYPYRDDDSARTKI